MIVQPVVEPMNRFTALVMNVLLADPLAQVAAECACNDTFLLMPGFFQLK